MRTSRNPEDVIFMSSLRDSDDVSDAFSIIISILRIWFSLPRKLPKNHNSWVITAALNEADITQEEEQKLLSLLDDDDKKKIIFVQAYIRRQSIDKGEEWIKNLVETAQSQQWQTIKIVNLFNAFPRERFVWDFLESFNEEIRNGYWNNVDLHYFNVSSHTKLILYFFPKFIITSST